MNGDNKFLDIDADKKIIQIVRSTLKSIGKPPEKGGFHIEDYVI